MDAAPDASRGWESQSKQLAAATVTVRIWTGAEPAENNAAAENAAPAESTAQDENRVPAEKGVASQRAKPAVIICSGVCVGPGLVVTSGIAGSDSKIRLTLAGGQQADATLRVLDEYSGLILLRCAADGLQPLELGGEIEVGNWVLSAAAWGTDRPIVSLGIVGGIDRSLRGATYPPLLQCDLRTTETSSGSAVVDRHGKLVGVLVAADHAESRRGWAYAVPVPHVQRLLRAEGQRDNAGQQDSGKQDAEKQDAGVIILKRRRPIVGMVLEGDENVIQVQRIAPGGPAEKAGLQVGDRVVAVAGVHIRSVYQAVLPTLYKQPGDTIEFRIERDGRPRDCLVVLGGGVEVASAPFEQLGNLIQPKLEIGRDPQGGYFANRPGSTTAEVFSPPFPPEPKEPPRITSADKISLLEKAIERYQRVIEIQQQDLARREADRLKTEALLRSLQSDLSTLRQQLQKVK